MRQDDALSLSFHHDALEREINLRSIYIGRTNPRVHDSSVFPAIPSLAERDRRITDEMQ